MTPQKKNHGVASAFKIYFSQHITKVFHFCFVIYFIYIYIYNCMVLPSCLIPNGGKLQTKGAVQRALGAEA